MLGIKLTKFDYTFQLINFFWKFQIMLKVIRIQTTEVCT